MLRAAAVLLVTWLHSSQQSFSHFGISIAVSTTFRIANLGMFGVDIFFAISGFILTMVAIRPGRTSPPRQAATFILRRVIRIYPIYWILLLLPIGRLAHQHRLDIGLLLRSLFLLPGLGVPIATPLISYAWTLIFEMFFYLTITLFIFVNPRQAPRNMIWALLALVGGGVVLGVHHPILILVANPILLEFVAGALLALWYQRLVTAGDFEVKFQRSLFPLRLGSALLLAGVVFTALVTWAFPANSSIEGNTVWGMQGWQRIATWGLAGWLLTAGTVFLSTGLQAATRNARPGLLFRLAVFCGDASYSIYLSSAFTMEQVGRVLEHIHPPDPPSALLVHATTGLSAVLVVLFGMAFHVLVERPVTSWLQHRIHSRPYSTAQLPPPVSA